MEEVPQPVVEDQVNPWRTLNLGTVSSFSGNNLFHSVSLRDRMGFCPYRDMSFFSDSFFSLYYLSWCWFFPLSLNPLYHSQVADMFLTGLYPVNSSWYNSSCLLFSLKKVDPSKTSTLEAAAKPEPPPPAQEEKKTPSKASPFLSFFKPKVRQGISLKPSMAFTICTIECGLLTKMF